MEVLEILSNIASIAALFMSGAALYKVNKLSSKTSVGGNVSFDAKGDNSQQALGNISNQK